MTEARRRVVMIEDHRHGALTIETPREGMTETTGAGMSETMAGATTVPMGTFHGCTCGYLWPAL